MSTRKFFSVLFVTIVLIVPTAAWAQVPVNPFTDSPEDRSECLHFCALASYNPVQWRKCADKCPPRTTSPKPKSCPWGTMLLDGRCQQCGVTKPDGKCMTRAEAMVELMTKGKADMRARAARAWEPQPPLRKQSTPWGNALLVSVIVLAGGGLAGGCYRLGSKKVKLALAARKKRRLLAETAKAEEARLLEESYAELVRDCLRGKDPRDETDSN